MERNQFKKRGGMHELNFLDSVENVISNYTVPGVIYHAFKDDGVKSKNPTLKPFEFVVNELDPVKINSSGISLKTPQIVKDSETALKLIEQDIKWLGSELVIGGNYVVNGIETVGKDIYSGGRTIYRIGSKSIDFVENYYPFILFGIGTYLGARYVNELKQTLS